MTLETLTNETLEQIGNRYLKVAQNMFFWNTKYTPAEVEALSRFTVAMHDQFGDTTWKELPKAAKANPDVLAAYENFERQVYSKLEKEGGFKLP